MDLKKLIVGIIRRIKIEGDRVDQEVGIEVEGRLRVRITVIGVMGVIVILRLIVDDKNRRNMIK